MDSSFTNSRQTFARDNYVGEVHSAVDNFNRRLRTTEVLFGVKILTM